MAKQENFNDLLKYFAFLRRSTKLEFVNICSSSLLFSLQASWRFYLVLAYYGKLTINALNSNFKKFALLFCVPYFMLLLI